MTTPAARKYLPKAKKPVSRHAAVYERRPDHCIRCALPLDPAKFHDCGDQPQLGA